MITLYIKGVKQDAIDMAHKANMTLVYLEEYEVAPNYTLVKAMTFEHYFDTIATLFREPVPAPYPPGSIVYYTIDSRSQTDSKDISP